MALESVSIRLEKEQVRAIESLAARRGASFAEVFRELVRAHFQSERDERAREETEIVRRLDLYAERLGSVEGSLRTLAGLSRELESLGRILRDDRERLAHFVGTLQGEARESIAKLAGSAQDLRTGVERLHRAARRHTWKAWLVLLAFGVAVAFGSAWFSSWLWAARHPYAAKSPAELQALYYGVQVQRALVDANEAERRKILARLGIE